MPQLELRRRRSLISAQGSRNENPGDDHTNVLTLKGFANRWTLSGLNPFYLSHTQGSRSSNPGLRLANAFGVSFNFKLMHYPKFGSY